MQFQPASLVTPFPIEWLWPGYLAAGSLAVLDGDPGLGKSLLTLDLAARVTTGRPWPDGAAASSPAAVLLLCAEDIETVVVARLQALGADLDRAYLWRHVHEHGWPRLPSDIGCLDEALEKTHGKLVIIDPIVAFLDKAVAMNSDAAVRRALLPLARLAEQRGCVILLVRHLNKNGGAHALYRGGGSIGIVAACRLAWLVGRDPRSEDRVILAQAKNNYSPRQPSLAYSLVASNVAASVPACADPVASSSTEPVPAISSPCAESVAASFPACGDPVPSSSTEAVPAISSPCAESVAASFSACAESMTSNSCSEPAPPSSPPEPSRQANKLAATTPPRLQWHGPTLWTADELASRRPRPSRQRAREFLRDFLASAPRLSDEVWTAARAQGISNATMRRAKDDLSIRCEPLTASGKRIVFWLLPNQNVPAGISDTPAFDDWLRRWKEQYPTDGPASLNA